jgi:four helix bundle protein
MESKLAKGFPELHVYQLAYDSAMLVFRISAKFPREEKYSLTDQIRRASRSVCTNIAEAWMKRRYEKSFISKLTDSLGEAAEVAVWVQFSCDCDYIDKGIYADLSDRYDHIAKQLNIMISDSSRWTGN